MTTAKSKLGRPSTFSQDLADQICAAVASSSLGIKKLCAGNPHFPSHSTVYEWLSKNADFRDSYARAKALQVEILIDEVIEIADDASQDSLVNENGKLACNSEWINRSRLRIDSRKWIASKLAPRIYGDRVKVDAEIGMTQEQALKLLE